MLHFKLIKVLGVLALAVSAKASEGLALQYEARQIIAHKCWKCHGLSAMKGTFGCILGSSLSIPALLI